MLSEGGQLIKMSDKHSLCNTRWVEPRVYLKFKMSATQSAFLEDNIFFRIKALPRILTVPSEDRRAQTVIWVIFPLSAFYFEHETVSTRPKHFLVQKKKRKVVFMSCVT